MICSRKVIRNRDPTRLYSQLSLAMKKAEFDSVSHETKEKKAGRSTVFSLLKVTSCNGTAYCDGLENDSGREGRRKSLLEQSYTRFQ